MNILAWLRRLLGLGPSTSPETTSHDPRPQARGRASAPAGRPARPAQGKSKPGSRSRGDRVKGALPASTIGGVSAASLTEIAISRAQQRLGKVGHLDDDANLSVVLGGADEDLMWNIERRIQRGKFQLPQLPSTSMAAIEMTNHPSTDIAELSTMISADPLLCSELLKTANSVLYAAHVPAETLHEAIMRVGMRTLRSLIFSVSMRGVILKGHGLNEYAEEVWRQALSIAAISRAIAKDCRIEPEKAFMIGLLQDVGKIALLTMLREEVRNRGEVNPALVGKLFHKYHESAGRAMGEAWRLPAELTSVAGSHHEYHDNEDFPQSAAFACLAHKLDLFLSLGDEDAFLELVRSDMMDFLQVPAEARVRILHLAQEAYEKAHEAVAQEVADAQQSQETAEA